MDKPILVTRRQAAKVTFESESIAETIKNNAKKIFADYPSIRVKYGREKDSRDNTPPPDTSHDIAPPIREPEQDQCYNLPS